MGDSRNGPRRDDRDRSIGNRAFRQSDDPIRFWLQPSRARWPIGRHSASRSIGTIHREHRSNFCEHPSTRRMGDVAPLFGLRKDGGEFPVSIWLSPLFLREQLTSIVVAVRDLTEQRRIETSLRRAERMASLGILTAGIAHEINSPVGAALLTAEAALTIALSDGQNGRMAACLENIVSAMERCGKTVQNILKFARNEPGEQIECDLNDRVWHVQEILRPYAAERRATINFTSRATINFNSRAKSLPIYASPLEIEILIGNLVRNAIESREMGAAVELRTEVTESLIELCVSDNGAGMPESQMTQIFEPFFTTRQNIGGTGLGLSIVYRIAQHHQASIDVQSSPGAGTSVRVHFPRVELAKASAPMADSDQVTELH